MTTNDTRTARERAEEQAVERYNGPISRLAFTAGFLARDAEPTTITAEQIENAAREFLRYTETASPDERSSATSWERARRIARMILLAADIRIEGEPA